MFQNIKDIWLTISLKRKIGSFAVMVILVMGLSVAFNIRIMDFSLGSFNVILDDNSRCHDFQEAMELEIKAFEVYVRDRTQENRDEYVLACVRSVRCLRSLPFDYERIGEERYARTWNVKRGTARPAISCWRWIPALRTLFPVCTRFMICSLTFRPTPEDWCR